MKYRLFFLILTSFLAIEVKSQNYTLNLQKYWWYRYRLVNDFMKVGPDFGESILSEQRRRYPGSPLANVYNIHWGDALGKQSNYLVLLATEYKLLSLAGLSTGRTKEEIYYAVNAVNRLDIYSEEYYRQWNNPVGGVVTGIINHPVQKNIGMVPQYVGTDVWTNDFNGHYIRDDVSQSFMVNNTNHFNRPGLCLIDRVTNATSDFIQRNNDKYNLALWTSQNSNHRVPVEISLDNATELIKGLALVVYLLPQTETVTISGNVYSVKDMAKEALLRLVNYCSNPHTATLGSVLGWRNWQIVNPVGKWCVYGVDGNLSNPCMPGAGGGANMSGLAMGAKDVLNKINAGWNTTQTGIINNLTYAPQHWALYQLSKGIINYQGGTWPLKVDCAGDGMLFSTTLACIANDWRLAGTFNVTEYFVKGQSFPCQIRYPHLPLIYRVLHGGSMPRPENPFLFVYSTIPWLNPIQSGNQSSYVSILNAAPGCGPSSFQDRSPRYASWFWSSYDWVTEAKKRGEPADGYFPGADYMSVFNLYCMNEGSYPTFYSNPYYRENLSQIYPYTNSSGTFGSASNPTYLKYLEYLSTTSHVTSSGRVTYRAGKQIELLPGFQADNGSNFLAFIKDYTCGNCGNDPYTNNNSFMQSSSQGDSTTNTTIDEDGPYTIDSLEDIVPFVPYTIPIDSEIHYEPTDSLLRLDSLDLYSIIMNSGDSDVIRAVLQLTDTTSASSHLRRTHGGSAPEIKSSVKSFTIYPNPNKGSFTIQLPDAGYYEIAVFDLIGKTHYRGEFTGSRYQLDMNNPPPGNYTIRVTDPDGVKISKFLVLP